MRRSVIVIALALVAFALVGQSFAVNVSNDQVALLVLSASSGDHIDSRWNNMPNPRSKEDSDLIGCEINVHSDKVPVATLMTRDDGIGVAELWFHATVKGVDIGPCRFDVNVVEKPEDSTPAFSIEQNGLIVTLLRYQEKP